MNDLAQIKVAARKAGFARRKVAFGEQSGGAAGHLSALLAGYRGVPMSGYMPIRTEIDPLPSMAKISFYGKVGVPVIQGANEPLLFAAWTPRIEMIEGQFGAKVPLSKNFFTPELLIVPLVAFDRKGGRVGYGGGFYDRTLEKLKMDKPVLAVGFAYSCQEIERVPLEKTDQRLDFVVTEKDVLDLRLQL